MTDWLAMIVLGLVQGATEFLPVSSSGHLVIGGELLGHHELAIRDVVILHVGTLVGMTVFFRDELRVLLGLGSGVTTTHDIPRDVWRLWRNLAIGTAVTVMIAFSARSWFESAFESLLAVGCGLFVTATALLLTAKLALRRATRGVDEMTMLDAGLIGLVQAFAIWPGVSRSGSTISAGLALGIRQEAAARFSFLLAFPAIGGATLDSVLDGASANGIEQAPIAPVLVGAGVAALSGYLALVLLFHIFRRTSLAGFAYYCFAAGALALGLHFLR